MEHPPIAPPTSGAPASVSRRSTLIGLLAGLVVGAWTYVGLLLPSRVLWARDLVDIHRPLRAAFLALLRDGMPWWNPWFSGGQPVFSYPTYAAFYPPAWPLLLFGADRFVEISVLVHAALAAWGAFRLATALGCRPWVGWIAAIAFSCGAPFVGLVHALPMLIGFAWFPWALLFAWRTFRSEDGWLRNALLTAVCLALQLTGGDAAVAFLTALAIAACALEAGVHAPRRLLRLVPIPLVAAALAAAQLLPTWLRFHDSPRAGGLDVASATAWSLPPLRLVELIAPFAFGDPSELGRGLFYGWQLHDKAFPYVMSLAPGLLLLLGAAAFFASRRPGRLTWGLAAIGGLLLALGRHTPLYAWAREVVPMLGSLRYPEKFVLLLVGSLIFAGALGLEAIAAGEATRRSGTRRAPQTMAVALVAAGLAASVVALMAPQLAAKLASHFSGAALSSREQLAAIAFYRREALVLVALAAASAALLWLLVRAPQRQASLVVVAGLLLLVDLGHARSRLIRTRPGAAESSPPLLIQALPPPPLRLFANAKLVGAPSLTLRVEGPEASPYDATLAGLEPFTATVWGYSYTLTEDKDKTATRWARHAREAFVADAGNPEFAARHLAAWSTRHLLVQRSPRELVAAWTAGERPVVPARIDELPAALPELRFVAAATTHPDLDAALAASRAAGLEVGALESLVLPAAPPRLAFDGAAEIVSMERRPADLTVRYRAADAALLVVASTFDPQWRASVDGQSAPVIATGLGQIAVLLPTGEHELYLAFRDRSVYLGLAISALAVLALVVVLRPRSRRP